MRATVGSCLAVGLAIGLSAGGAAAKLPGISADEARLVASGEIVDRRVVKGGVVHSVHAGRVQAPPSWVSHETWSLCNHPLPEQLVELRFFDVETVAKVGMPPSQLEEEAVRALESQPCPEVIKASRFFSFAVFDAPAFMPDMWSFIDNVRTDRPDGGSDIRAEQVAGSMGSIVTTTHIRLAEDDGSDWSSIISLSIGIPMPDALLNIVVPKADEPPRMRLLQSLRKRAKARPRSATLPVAAP